VAVGGRAQRGLGSPLAGPVVRDELVGGFNVLVFFFSSRRRHTRSKRDWSSDVCSSDLTGSPKRLVTPWRVITRGPAPERARRGRSEERRVGKECRSQWSPQHRKKKKHVYARLAHAKHTNTSHQPRRPPPVYSHDPGRCT